MANHAFRFPCFTKFLRQSNLLPIGTRMKHWNGFAINNDVQIRFPCHTRHVIANDFAGSCILAKSCGNLVSDVYSVFSVFQTVCINDENATPFHRKGRVARFA